MRVNLIRSVVRHRWVGGALAALIVAAGLTVAGPAAPAAAATSCYGGAINLKYLPYYSTDFGPYTTTSRCRDINFRSTSNAQVDVCVIFVEHTNQCNYETTVGTSWKVIASNVLDGTRFVIRVFGSDTPGDPFLYAKAAF